MTTKGFKKYTKKEFNEWCKECRGGCRIKYDVKIWNLINDQYVKLDFVLTGSCGEATLTIQMAFHGMPMGHFNLGQFR